MTEETKAQSPLMDAFDQQADEQQPTEKPENSTEQEAVEEKPEEVVSPDENAPAEGESTESEVQEVLKPVPFDKFEKRIGAETRKRKILEEQLHAERQRIAQIEAKLQEKQTSVPKHDPATEIVDPLTNQVVPLNSVEGYVAQREQVREAIKADEVKKKAAEVAQREAHGRKITLKARLEKGYDKFADYEETVSSLPATDIMLTAIGDDTEIDAFLYNVAKHKKDEVERISKLSPEKQFREMVLLENEYNQSLKKKTVKSIPEPISQLKGSGKSEISSSKIMTDDDYDRIIELRRKEERSRFSR